VIADLYGGASQHRVSRLNLIHKPHAAQRANHGKPRVLPQSELDRYCELIAALKLPTTDKQRQHLSTRCAIERLDDYGVETEQALGKVPKGTHQGHAQIWGHPFSRNAHRLSRALEPNSPPDHPRGYARGRG
jgi:hypothetical protein